MRELDQGASHFSWIALAWMDQPRLEEVRGRLDSFLEAGNREAAFLALGSLMKRMAPEEVPAAAETWLSLCRSLPSRIEEATGGVRGPGWRPLPEGRASARGGTSSRATKRKLLP